MNMNESEFVTPLRILIRVAIANETHFLVKEEQLCQKFEEKKSSSPIKTTQWLAIIIQNGGLTKNQQCFHLRGNGEPFYWTGNTSELLVIRTDQHIDGYFVLYDDLLFQRILNQLQLNRSAIPLPIRNALLSDYFYFAGLG